MTKINQLNKAKSAIENALKITADVMPNNKHMIEAKIHLRQAIQSVEKAASVDSSHQKKQTQFESWWGNIVAGTAKMSQAQLSTSTISKNLSKLQALIDEENNKINKNEIKQAKNNSSMKNNQDIFNE